MPKAKFIPLLEPDAEVRPISGFEGLYSVTRDGRVWSHAKRYARGHHGGKWLKPGLGTTLYLLVVMTKDGRQHTAKVHRLVGLAWIPNPDKLPEINHKNGIKTDNRDVNLEWCTRTQNNAHAHRTGLNKTRRVLTPERLAGVRAAIATGEQGKDIAARFGIKGPMVSTIKTGKYVERKHPLTQGERV